MSPLKWLLSNQLKRSRVKQKVDGFTLIELLVGIVMAFLIITPLLGFMINVLDNDRKEQAKATSEQELKTTLDYITRDLQQAVYIYDASGIEAIRKYLPNYAEKDQNFPVLVFWKRQYIQDGLTVQGGTDDTFVYSLVAYYLINDGDTTTWSNAARIGRFQISDGYGKDDTEKDATRDVNFKLFNLSNDGLLKEKMNKWESSDKTDNYTQKVLPLVDYIDQTTIDADKNPVPTTCPVDQIVPNFSGSGDSAPTGNVNTRGFYVCVDSDKNVAEVYLRGNVIARLQNDNLAFDDDNDSRKVFFPQASTRVQGIGVLVTK